MNADPQTPAKRPFAETWRAITYVSGLAFRQQPWLVGLNGISALVDALVPILYSYLAARLTTTLYEAATARTAPARDVYLLIVITAAVALARSVFSTYISTMASYMEDRMRVDMKEALVNKFASLSFAAYEDKAVMDVYDRATEFAGNVSWVFRRIIDVGGGIVGAAGAAIALATVSPYIALALTIGLLPGFVLRLRIQKERYEFWHRNTSQRRVANQAQGTVAGAKSIWEVRLLGLVEHLVALTRDIWNKELEQERRYDVRQRSYDLLQGLLVGIVENGALIWVAFRIISQGLPVGQFIFFQQVMGQFSGRVSSVLGAFQGVSQDIDKSFDFYDFMNLPQTEAVGTKLPAVGVPEIRFDGVWFRYPGSEHYALEDVSLVIRPGEKVALVGENGAGKSTLVKLILGLYVAERGSVTIGGVPSGSLQLSSWFAHLGVLFQDFQRFSFATARDSVRYGRVDRSDSGDAAVRAAMDQARVTFLDRLPNGLDTFLSKHVDKENGTELSGGQWQRLALARNFYREPDVLILDEPTSAIDAKAESEIFENVMEATRNRTAVIVSHRFSTVRRADRIYVLERAKVIESGSHEELLAEGGHYKELFEKQAVGYR